MTTHIPTHTFNPEDGFPSTGDTFVIVDSDGDVILHMIFAWIKDGMLTVNVPAENGRMVMDPMAFRWVRDPVTASTYVMGAVHRAHVIAEMIA